MVVFVVILIYIYIYINELGGYWWAKQASAYIVVQCTQFFCYIILYLNYLSRAMPYHNF